MRVVQIGVGAWGASWLPVVQASPCCELVGAVDVDEPARRSAQASGVPAERTFATLGEAQDSGLEADAALIVVPPRLHAPLAVSALQAGLHCVIEKPLADQMEAGHAVVQAARHADRYAMVSQNYRFKRAPRTVARLVREGTIGEVEQVFVDFQKNPSFTGFRLEMDEPLITDMAVHHLDQMRGVLGLEPRSLRAWSWNPSWSSFDGNACARIDLTTESGARVVYTGSWVSHGAHTSWDGSWDIQGRLGGVRWAQNRVEVRFASVFDTVFMQGALEREGRMEVELDVLEVEERQGVLAELRRAVDQRSRPETDVRDNIRSLGLMLAAVTSAKAGGEEIDLERFCSAPPSPSAGSPHTQGVAGS